MQHKISPKSLGFHFPAEWHPHRATWFTVPHNDHSWQGDKLEKMYDNYLNLLIAVSKAEQVCLNVNSATLQSKISAMLMNKGADMSRFEFLQNPTNDAWCRDHGPAFLINEDQKQKIIVDWEYNAWGGKYPPYDDDNRLPQAIAKYLELPCVSPGIIMEGGSVEFNGKGTILTTKSCLLNPNRNPHLSQENIESYLCEYYGAEQILWLQEGIVGDDTDGHIDDITRFINEDTVITMVEHNKHDENYDVLNKNLKLLQKMRLLNGKQLNIVELPMPDALVVDDFRVPASYGNFLICNAAVLVPTFKQKTDQLALDILSKHIKDRPVIGLDSTDIIWGQGSFHCLSQQEPLA